MALRRNVECAIFPRSPWRRDGAYIDKILKGGNPATLLVEPPRLELVIDLKTAEKIGVTIPPEILLETNEVIKQYWPAPALAVGARIAPFLSIVQDQVFGGEIEYIGRGIALGGT